MHCCATKPFTLTLCRDSASWSIAPTLLPLLPPTCWHISQRRKWSWRAFSVLHTLQIYPPQRPILPGDVRAQAEHDATELRQRLGLGINPVPDIVILLEMELGVRVYVRKLDAEISGLFVYDEALGPCILLNANHSRERRTQSAGHECGHFLSARRNAEILYRDKTESSREERYASAFGRAF